MAEHAAEHPFKVLQDAIAMYQSRVAVALEERRTKYRKVGMFLEMGGASRVVPDMRVLCLDRDQLLERVDRQHPSVSGALAMMDGAAIEDASTVPFGVLFADGGTMVTTLTVHDADRERR